MARRQKWEKLDVKLSPNESVTTKRQPIRQLQKEELCKYRRIRDLSQKDVVPAGIEPASKV